MKVRYGFYNVLLSLLCLVPVIATAAPGKEMGAPQSVDALCQRLSSIEVLIARFKEEKVLGLLSKPLISEGQLAYSAPNTLVRLIEKPRAVRVVVEPHRLVTITDAKTDELDLSSRPEVQSLVGSLLIFLRGDCERLKTTYEVFYKKEGHTWVLSLTPRSQRLQALVKQIRFEGQNTMLARIFIEEGSGDRSSTYIDGVQIDPKLSKSQHTQYFEVQ